VRLDPLDEILRLYQILTAAERVAFLAAIATDPRGRPPSPAARTAAPDVGVAADVAERGAGLPWTTFTKKETA